MTNAMYIAVSADGDDGDVTTFEFGRSAGEHEITFPFHASTWSGLTLDRNVYRRLDDGRMVLEVTIGFTGSSGTPAALGSIYVDQGSLTMPTEADPNPAQPALDELRRLYPGVTFDLVVVERVAPLSIERRSIFV